MPFACQHSQLEQHIAALLGKESDDTLLTEAIDTLAGQYGDQVYTAVLCLLVGKNFSAELSRNYWQAALEHGARIFQGEFAQRGLRPALLDYLHREIGELEDPRILEADFLRNISITSVTDGLTGLFHQTYFKDHLGLILANNRRQSDLSFAIILLDLDHFKQYNDCCGHLAGDEALRRTAEIIRNSLREGDIAARYGGEEFALLLPNADRKTAFAVADRIRRAVEVEAYPQQERLDRRNLTVSGGVATYPADGQTVDMLIEAADRELYRAKTRRNCISPQQINRRRSIRRPACSLVEYASFQGTFYRPAFSLEISETGISVGCERFLSPGMVLSLRLSRPFWSEDMQLSAVVRQVRQQEELVFLGLEFEQPIPDLARVLRKRPLTTAAKLCAQ